MNLRDLSKNQWEQCDNTLPSIDAGSLQRIADATEKMAGNFTALQNERDYLKRELDERRAYCKRQDNVIRALRGHLTRKAKQ